MTGQRHYKIAISYMLYLWKTTNQFETKSAQQFRNGLLSAAFLRMWRQVRCYLMLEIPFDSLQGRLEWKKNKDMTLCAADDVLCNQRIFSTAKQWWVANIRAAKPPHSFEMMKSLTRTNRSASNKSSNITVIVTMRFMLPIPKNEAFEP